MQNLNWYFAVSASSSSLAFVFDLRAARSSVVLEHAQGKPDLQKGFADDKQNMGEMEKACLLCEEGGNISDHTGGRNIVLII